MATATETETETTQSPGPGIYEDVPFERYLEWPYVNNSLLKHANRSMAHAKAVLDGRVVFKSTDATRFGSFCHCGRLETLAIAARYAVMPPYHLDSGNVTKKGEPTESKNSAYYNAKVEDFERVNAGKEIVLQCRYDDLIAMAKRLREHPRAVQYLDAHGPVEVSIVWDDPDTGVRCKGRIDKLSREQSTFCDYKTTRDAAGFARQIVNFGYHRQLALYADGLRVLTAETFVPCIVAQETTEPFGVRAAPLSHDAIETGRGEYKPLLGDIARCIRSGDWPGYHDPPSWNLPSWYDASSEPVTLQINGKSISI